MPRYSDRQPFTTAADFVVVRSFTINGVSLAPGDAVPKDGVADRVLRNLYDQRKIDIAPAHSPATAAPQRAAKADAAPRAPKPRAEAQSAPVAPATAPVNPQITDAVTQAPAYRVKHAGLGGFKVIDAKGVPVGKGFPTKAEAEAEIARLTEAAS